MSHSLTLIREFFGLSKKSKNIACDVTVETKKIENICTDRVSVGVLHDAYFKWHMPI